MAKHVAVVWVTLWLLVASGVQAQNQFTVGTEDINFYPHYNFTRADGVGFANEVLQLFAANQGYQFNFQPLPVKRLYP